jgi:uncharacterized protein (DUF362 family)
MAIDPTPDREPVYLWDMPEYDPDRIRDAVARSMAGMGVKPTGRVLIKPNTVAAHPVFFTHAYARAEVLDGVAAAVKAASGPDVTEVAVGERCGITIPTRFAFRNAGYAPILKKHGLKRYLFDEERPVEVALKNPDRLRDRIFVPEPIAKTDFLVCLPKFKTHPWTTVTFSLKNYIGIQDDAHRLIDHDFHLDRKVADLQDVVPQRLIVIDAVIGGSGRMLTPRPVPLGMIIVGRNPVAVDTVCCAMLGLDARSVAHIRLCGERGLGPLDLSAIDVRGDVPLEQAKERCRPMQVGLVRVEDYFAGSRITALAGPPPDPEGVPYCWGGCPGAVEEAIEIIERLQPDARNAARKLRIVYGDMRGKDLREEEGEYVVFLGDCARYSGTVFGLPTEVESVYVPSHGRDPRHAHADDIFVKMAVTLWKMLMVRARGKKVLVIRGCPVSVAEHVLFLSALGGLKNPYLDPSVVLQFAWHWLASKSTRLVRRATGRLRPTLLDP